MNILESEWFEKLFDLSMQLTVTLVVFYSTLYIQLSKTSF